VWVFKVRVKVATKSQFYHYTGLMFISHLSGQPQAKVMYNDGKISQNMAIGNAVDYAKMFGGEVIMPS